MYLKSKALKYKINEEINESLCQVVVATSNFKKKEGTDKNIRRTKPNIFGERKPKVPKKFGNSTS